MDPVTNPDIPPKAERTKSVVGTKMVIEYRRYLVSQGYLRGRSMEDIARTLPPDLRTTRQTVFRDICWLRQQWVKAADSNVAEKKAKNLARIDELERTAWEAFEASKGDKILSKHGKMVAPPAPTIPGAPAPPPGPTGGYVRTVTKTSAGNPQFLEIVRKCIDMRNKMIGGYLTEEQNKLQSTPVLGVKFIFNSASGQEVKEVEAFDVDSQIATESHQEPTGGDAGPGQSQE